MIKSKILIGVMALALVGGIGSAFALTRNPGVGTGTSPSFDGAIYLYWDHESTASAAMTPIATIGINEPVYRVLTVAPKSTKSVSGTVTVGFTLAEDTGTVITGLSVDVYAAATDPTENPASAATGSAAVSLSPSAKTGSTTFQVEGGGTDIRETKQYYVIKVVYNGSNTSSTPLGGIVTISQSFEGN